MYGPETVDAPIHLVPHPVIANLSHSTLWKQPQPTLHPVVELHEGGLVRWALEHQLICSARHLVALSFHTLLFEQAAAGGQHRDVSVPGWRCHTTA